jgi:hypothetical protein
VTTSGYRGSRAADDVSTRLEATATPSTNKLLRLFRRTLKDQTPQQRRLLAGAIALEIPEEAVTLGNPEPLWMQRLRTFVRRELDLDPPRQPAPAVVAGAADARTLGGPIRDVIDEAGGGRQVPLHRQSVRSGRPPLSMERARGLLLLAIMRFYKNHDLTQRVTNVALAEAARVNPDTIGNWLACTGWTLEDLDVEWARQRAKKPE